MDSRTFRIALLIAAALTIGVRASWIGEASPGPLSQWWAWEGSEAAGQLRAARAVSSGDLLLRDVNLRRQDAVSQAVPSDAWASYYGADALPFPPGYAWITSPFVRSGPFTVVLLQTLAAALRTVLVGVATALLFGRGAGVAASIFAALLGPLVLVDSLFVPQGVALLASAGALALLAGGYKRSDVRFFGAAGGCLGAAALLADAALLAVLGALAAVAASSAAGRSDRTRNASMLLAGFALVFVPRMARDVATGSRVLPPSPGAIVAIARNAEPAGGGVLVAGAEGGFVRTVFAANRVRFSREGAQAGLVSGVSSAFGVVEVPDDDFDFEYARAHSLTLTLLPDFHWLLVFAVAGVWAAGARGVMRLVPSREARGIPALTVAPVVALAVAFALASVSGRTRLAIVPWMLPVAGFGAAALAEAVLRGRRARAARLAVAVLCLHLFLLALPGDRERWRRSYRIVDVSVGAGLLASRGNYAGAIAELELGRKWSIARARNAREAAGAVGLLEREGLKIALALGHHDDARRAWEKLRQVAPDDPVVRRAEEIFGAPAP